MDLDRNIACPQPSSPHTPESYDTAFIAGADGNFERDDAAYANMGVQAEIASRLVNDPIHHVELAPDTQESETMPIEIFVILFIIGLSYVNAAWIFNVI